MSELASETSPRRVWATSSLVAALVWIVLAAMPVPGTTTIGLPFGFYAILAGLFSGRERRAANDRTGARRAGWGVGLGCVGFIIAVGIDLILVGVLLGGIIAAIRLALGVHFR